MSYTCLMCKYKDMPFEPNYGNMCPCCGTRFYGNEDLPKLYEEWKDKGFPLHSYNLEHVSKLPAISLNKEDFAILRVMVLTRDKFRCRKCKRINGLSLHHIIKKSYKRLDTIWNLISLCTKCHAWVECHRTVIKQEPHRIVNASKPVQFFRNDPDKVIL